MNPILELQNLLPANRWSQNKEDLTTYGQDWSGVLTPNPSMICFPRSTEEVSKILKFCNDHKISVVPSGGRTGLSGGAVACNQELVLSLSKMNSLAEVDIKTLTLRVGAGAITEAVHEHCKPFGLCWPVDFASKGSSQVGGNINTNAGGINVIRYGNTRQWIQSLEVVLMSGEILELNRDLEKNNTGYDFRHLIIGSEGTLAVVTAATLKLAPLPPPSRLFAFTTSDIQNVVKLLELARSEHLDLLAFEYLNPPSLERSSHVFKANLPFAAENASLVLVEAVKSDERIDRFLERAFEGGIVLDGTEADNSEKRQLFWKLREGVAEAIVSRGYIHQHDISVPLKYLAKASVEIENFYATHYPDFYCFVFGHIGDGNLHIFIQSKFKLEVDDFLKQAKTSDEKLFQLIHSFQGSVSAEHGIGLLKKPGLPYSKTQTEIELMKAIKKAFDPRGLLNPDKLLSV